jgi:DNA primase
MPWDIDTTALKSLVEDSGISYRKNSVSWIFDCPKCNKRDKLYMRQRDGRFVCWFCATTINYQGRAEFALRDLLGVSLADIKLRLYGEDGHHYSPGNILGLPPLEDFFSPAEYIPFDIIPLKEMPFPLDYYPIDEPEARRGREYLEGRGVDMALAQKYGLRYYPLDCRVIFPILVEGRVIGWQGRSILPEKVIDAEGIERRVLKILTPKGVDRNRVLMFQDNLKGSEHAVVGEGPFDGIKADLCGGNVATMGKSVSKGQIQLIKNTPGMKRVYLAIDPDAAAELTRLCREFSDFEVFHMIPSGGFEDFGAMSPESVLDCFRVARRVRPANVFLPPLLDWERP